MKFLEQFEALRLTVPRLSLMNFKETRSDFCNYTYACADSYSSVGSDFLDTSHYNYWGYHNTDCIDCTYCRDCVGCYDCIDCTGCKNSERLQDCSNCISCQYCFECSELEHCFACIGISHKKYYIFNKPYSPALYEQTVAKFSKKTPGELIALFRDVKKMRPHIAMRGTINSGVCTGDYITRSSDVRYAFDADRCVRSAYLNNAINCYQCFDISFAGEPPLEDCFEIMSGMGLKNCFFCSSCWHGENLEYCEYCFECRDCFGCVGLKGKQYYILNRPYDRKTYQEKAAAIKKSIRASAEYGHWFSSPYPSGDSMFAESTSAFQYHLFYGRVKTHEVLARSLQ